jgi:hypothetical protein
MKRAKHLEDGKGGIDLVEEAVHLFRAAPARTLAAYYAGTIPFVLGFLYYWVDMSRSPFAGRHLVEASLAVAALFFWMKLCQASFASRVRAQLAMKSAPQWGLGGSLRVLVAQITIHSTGLFILPLALLVMLPFAWVYAFYQNVTVLADPDSLETRALVKRAWKQATLWVFQNHSALAIGLLFALCILVNWALVAVMIPALLKMLVGIETAFSRSPIAMVNTTFFGIIVGVTYLCADPILKIIYVLRCFYGESLQSGDDIKADLKQYVATPRRVAVLIVLAVGLLFGTSIHAEVPPAQLDQKIEDVLDQPKYTWRLPRQGVVEADAEKGVLTRFFESAARLLKQGVNAVVDLVERVLRRVFAGSGDSGLPGFGWMRSSLLLYVLLGVLVCLLAVFIIRSRRRRAAQPALITATTIDNVPDLTDESIRADQLPEDGWTSLARQLLENKEYRLAMRAFYLASLANLAQRKLVGIAHFKSNRDYENELRRRGHSIPELLSLFAENLLMLERIWYGLHTVDREQVLRFATNVDRIKTAA